MQTNNFKFSLDNYTFYLRKKDLEKLKSGSSISSNKGGYYYWDDLLEVVVHKYGADYFSRTEFGDIIPEKRFLKLKSL